MWLVNARIIDVLTGEALPSRAIEIAPDGTIVFHYMNLNPNKHVEKTLGALRELKAKGK